MIIIEHEFMRTIYVICSQTFRSHVIISQLGEADINFFDYSTFFKFGLRLRHNFRKLLRYLMQYNRWDTNP